MRFSRPRASGCTSYRFPDPFRCDSERGHASPLCGRAGSGRGDRRNLQIPDLFGIFPDGAIARELSGARDVANGLGIPHRAIRVAAVELLVGASIVLEVGKVSIEVTAVEQCVADWVEHTRLMLRQKIGSDEIHGLAYLGISRVM